MGCVSKGKRSSSMGLLTCWGSIKGLTSFMSFSQKENFDHKMLGSMNVIIYIANAKKLYTCLQSTVAKIWNGSIYLSTTSDYSTSFPGSTCKIVFTLSKNTLARFSSPFAALMLKTFVDSALFEEAIIPGGGSRVLWVKAVGDDLPVKTS